MTLLDELICGVFGHRLVAFNQEQCPVDYFACSRCGAVRHKCNSPIMHCYPLPRAIVWGVGKSRYFNALTALRTRSTQEGDKE